MISVVIPLYNEEANMNSLVDSLIDLRKRERWDCEIVLVDDNSSDKTGEICDNYAKNKFIKVIHRKKGDNGMGSALREGTKKARGEVIIWTMGDNSDDINTFPKLVNKLNKGYDMVFGSRYMKGGTRGDLDLIKASVSGGYTFVCKLVFGFPVHDITNAFRCFRKEVFDKIKLESSDFAISPEFAIKAHLKGFKLGEVPTTYSNRKAGKTKMNILRMGVKYIELLKYRFMIKKDF